jgi:protein-L-isoaspartate(D-aspartate) O-methyltransferase
MNLLDSYRHQGLRKKLIENLRLKGISQEEVLSALMQVPRHFFLDPVFDEKAYEDSPMTIDQGQTISQPFTVAYQTQLLGVKSGEKILEIGTGSGFQAAILAQMGVQVYSLERHEILYEKAKNLLNSLAFKNIHLFFRDGFIGLPEHAPFDKILITCAVEEMPQHLFQQLKIEGQIIMPLGNAKGQTMVRCTKTSEQSYEKEMFDKFTFVPFVRGINLKEKKQ